MSDELSPLARVAAETIERHGLAASDAPVLLMVSGGSDSTALAYVARELHEAGLIGSLGMLHVNHRLRGEDADADARFTEELAELLEIPLFMYEIDVAARAARAGGNIEAVARHERYLAANEALRGLCRRAGAPISDGRIFTAHTADDRVESFYMRSIVGTGPGGFRAMRYENGPVARPLLDAGRDELRAYLATRERSGKPMACDAQGNLWREDATNAHTDQFRAYVRHEIVPRAKARNARLLGTLGRSMNLIADEDDYLESLAQTVAQRCIVWAEGNSSAAVDTVRSSGCTDVSRETSAFASGGVADAVGPDGGVADAVGPDGGVADAVGVGDDVASVAELSHCENVSRETFSFETGGKTGGAPAGFTLSPAFGEEPLVLRRRACFTALGKLLGPNVRVENAAVAAVLAAFDDAGKPKSGYVTNIQGNLAVSANKRGVRVEPMATFRARRKRC